MLSGSSVSTFDGTRKGFFSGAIAINHFLSSMDDADFKKVCFFGHDYSLENSEFISKFYPNIHLVSEKQPAFEREHLSQIRPIDKFEANFDRKSAGLSNANLQGTSAFAYSRSQVAKIASQSFNDRDQDVFGILTRWDLGYRGSFIVNRPHCLGQMDMDKVNVASYMDNDTGFADMWIISRLSNLRKFEKLYDHHNDIVYGNNSICQLLTTGWPYSTKRSSVEHTVYSRLRSLIPKLRRFGFNIKHLENYVEYKWHATAAKSNNYNEQERTFSIPEVLNNHIFLKAFILDHIGFDNMHFVAERRPTKGLSKGKFSYKKTKIAVVSNKCTEKEFREKILSHLKKFAEVEFFIENAGENLCYDVCGSSEPIRDVTTEFLLQNGVKHILTIDKNVTLNDCFDPITGGFILKYIDEIEYGYVDFRNDKVVENSDFPGTNKSRSRGADNVVMSVYELPLIDVLHDGSLSTLRNTLQKIRRMPMEHLEISGEITIGSSDLVVSPCPLKIEC